MIGSVIGGLLGAAIGIALYLAGRRNGRRERTRMIGSAGAGAALSPQEFASFLHFSGEETEEDR